MGKPKALDIIKMCFFQGQQKALTIHQLTGIPLRTIRYNAAKLRSNPNYQVPAKRGRPPKLNKNDRSSIRLFLKHNKRSSAFQIRDQLFKRHSFVSVWTVRRVLNKMGKKFRRPSQVQVLNQKQKEVRLRFCQEMVATLPEDHKIVFSDESGFSLNRNKCKAWCDPGQTEENDYKDQKKIINVWGGFSSSGKTNISIYTTNLNKEKYQEILKNNLLPFAEQQKAIHQPITFQQDNHPAHKAVIIREFLQNTQIKTLTWPPYSCDLNPIENLWAIMKSRRDRLKRRPKGSEELQRCVQTLWKEIPNLLCRKLSNSFLKRCKLVIQNQGGRINY
jgi:transposase